MSVNPRAPKGKAPTGRPTGKKAPPSNPKPGDPVPSAADKPTAAVDGKDNSAAAAVKTDTAPQVVAPTAHKRSPMEQEFDRLKGMDKLEEGVDAIGPKGLQALCADIGVTYNDFDMYVVVWKLGATQSYCITRSEWLHGAYTHKLEHPQHIRGKLSEWRSEVRNEEPRFTEMYYLLYDFIRGEQEKLLPQDKAIKAWQVLLPEPIPFAFLSLWVQWVTLEYKRDITRDVWRQVWEFARKIKNLESYDSNDKWPTALDDFVEWAKEKTAKKNERVVS